MRSGDGCRTPRSSRWIEFTGKEVWRAERTTRRSWATPIIVQADGRSELIASGAEMVAGYDPQNGEGAVARARRPEPSDPERRRRPRPRVPYRGQRREARDGDPARRQRAISARPTRSCGDIRRGRRTTASPVLHGDYLYLMSDGGIITCLDAKTGAVVYEGGRPPIAATFRSSLAAFGEGSWRPAKTATRSSSVPDRSTKCSARILSANRCGHHSPSPTTRSTSAARSTCLRSGAPASAKAAAGR